MYQKSIKKAKNKKINFLVILKIVSSFSGLFKIFLIIDPNYSFFRFEITYIIIKFNIKNFDFFKIFRCKTALRSDRKVRLGTYTRQFVEDSELLGFRLRHACSMFVRDPIEVPTYVCSVSSVRFECSDLPTRSSKVLYI